MKNKTGNSTLVTSIFTSASSEYVNVLNWCATFCLLFILGACDGGGGGSSSSSSSDSPSPNPPATAPDAPQNVQVVSGDGDSSELENTISWTLDTSATQYKVYWDTVPGVTENSSELIPATQGLRYVTHSGVDVVAGNAYYYRVQAISDDVSSSLSAEVTGTPQQSVTNNQLNDVAWNGVDTLIAVGDSGVILTSPNGLADAWTDASTVNAPQALTGVTWETGI